MTALDLITRSLRLIGVLAQGETPRAEDANDALATLNEMLDAWAADRLYLYNQVRTTYTLVPSQGSYTIGIATPPADFNQARPEWIDAVGLVLAGTSPPVEIPLRERTDDQWTEIPAKTLTSTLPSRWRFRHTYPLAYIDLWPVPTEANSLAIYAPVAPLSTVTLTTELSVPPGYAKALRYNLAVELAPEFGRVLDPGVAGGAMESRAAIKRANKRLEDLRIDPALEGIGHGYNIYTDEL